jgi:hypothetical protein
MKDGHEMIDGVSVTATKNERVVGRLLVMARENIKEQQGNRWTWTAKQLTDSEPIAYGIWSAAWMVAKELAGPHEAERMCGMTYRDWRKEM